MYKLGFEVAEEPEIKLPEFIGLWKKQGSSTNTPTSATDYTKLLTVWITANCGKFWKRWEYQTTLPVSWETCMHIKNQQLQSDMEQMTGSKLWKKYNKAIYCHPAYLTYMQSTSCKMLGWMNQTGIKISRRNTNNLRYGDDTTQMAESEEELKSFCWRWKRRVKELAWNLTLKNLRSLHLVP